MLQSSSFNKHLTKDEDRTAFYLHYNENSFLREVIRKTLIDKVESSIKEAESKDKYSTPNWEYYQSDNLGYRRALREVLNLLNLENIKEETQ